MLRRTALVGLLATATDCALAQPAPIPAGYTEVWSDDFKTLSLRTGGPTFTGLAAGSGIWAAPGAWFSSDPRGFAGDGYEWLVDPTYYGWPKGYPGPFAITPDGLRIRVEEAPAAIAALLPKIQRMGVTVTPWLGGQINSFHGVRIKPPFYFEARAKMPLGIGRPWPAIWLVTGTQKPFPNDKAKGYEIDLHEGFGDSVNLHMTVHWTRFADRPGAASQPITNAPSGVELSADFHRWACDVTIERQIFYFDDREVGRIESPPDAAVDQYYSIILGIGAGLPWKGGGPPSDGPHDLIIRVVKLYAPNRHRLVFNP
jgi:hypothetical protein